MIELWAGVNAVVLQYFEFGMNAMNNLMRSLIALPIIASLSVSGGVSIAAIPYTSHKASAETVLSLVGFLDFKTLIYSPGTGDNLDDVFYQIKFIGPEMFKNAALSHGILQKFKRSRSIVLPTNPIWGWDGSDLDVLKLDLNDKPLPASSGLVDAILTDITDNIRNYGVSWILNPGVGPGTAAYLNSATLKVIDQVEMLESAALTEPVISQTTYATQTVRNFPHPHPLFFFGLGLVVIGLLVRRLRKKSAQPVRKADPAACSHAIKSSPIRYAAKTV